MLLDLPRHVIRSVARFRLRVHTFALKPQLEIPPLPLLATCVRLMMSRMKRMFSFTACTLSWFLSARSTRSYFHRQDSQDVSAFLHQENNKLLFVIHEFFIFYEQVSSSYFLTEGLFSCKLVTQPCNLMSRLAVAILD